MKYGYAVVALVGVLCGALSTHTFIAGTWWNLVFWAVVAGIVGFCADTRRRALRWGTAYGFFLSVTFLFSGFQGASDKLVAFTILTAALSLIGMLGGALCAYIGNRMRSFSWYTVGMLQKSGIAAVVVVIAAVLYWWMTASSVVPVRSASVDYKSIPYTINGSSVSMNNGVAEAPAALGSASMTTTRYFGNEATGDLNGDGLADVAFLITQDAGGSGTFYYVVAALKTADGYVGTNAVLLGDRIAPQTTQIQNGEVIVNYADRNAGEPMTAAPSLGKSAYLAVRTPIEGGAPQLVQVNAPNR